MNKAIRLNTILFLIAVLMSCSAFALGIGTNNKVIGYEPNVQKSAGIYIINDEHKDMDVEISVAGSLAEYAKAPKTLFVSASEGIKKFSIGFTLPEGMKEGDLKVIVSEATAQNSQIGAKVHAVAEIKIDFSASAAKEEDTDVKKVDVKEQLAGLRKLAPSGAAKYSTVKALIIPIIAIVTIIIVDLIFYYRKRRAKLYPGHLSELGKL